MKQIYYIANVRLPTERAHGIQIMEMCQVFADIGLDVELIVPDRHTEIRDTPFKYYDIKENFGIKRLWCLDWVGFGKIGFWIQSLTFALSVAWLVSPQGGLFYTRDELIVICLKILGKNIVWEAHMGHKNMLTRVLIWLGVPIVAISDGLRDLYESMGSHNVITAPDGADIDRFDIDLSRDEARDRLGLAKDKRVILYKGSLIPWKGAGTLAESVAHTKSEDLEFVFIGGTPEDVENFKKDYGADERISIKGNRPRKETPIYQKAADILVIPNSAKEDISKLYTSPMKLFGYMAGGVPIIASDLPSLREIIGEDEAYFFKPDDPVNLAGMIDVVLGDYAAAKTRASAALEKVRVFSWKNRAKKIMEFIN